MKPLWLQANVYRLQMKCQLKDTSKYVLFPANFMGVSINGGLQKYGWYISEKIQGKIHQWMMTGATPISGSPPQSSPNDKNWSPASG